MQHSPDEIARAIANGHGFDKHVKSGQFEDDKRRGDDTGIRSRSDYENKIKEILKDDQTSSFARHNGGAVFYNEKQNIAVAYDPKSEDLGSCFRPTSKERYVDRCLERDANDRDVERKKEAQADRLGATVGSASKPRDQAEVLKAAQDKQRDTPDQKLTPEQRRAALQEASAAVAKDQAQQKKAWEAETDPKKKEQIALKAGIEQADFKRQTARENADLTAQEKGAQSPQTLKAKSEVRAADKAYNQGVAEWHKRSVRDNSYEPFDKKWSNEAERAKARESKSKDPQEKKDAALERQFNTTAGHGKGHGM